MQAMKKMNSIIAFAAAAVAVVFSVSCQQEIQVPDKDADAIEEKTPNEGKLITITATIPDNPETRVAFAQDPGTVKLTWENGDKIIIVDEADLMHPQTFELTSGDGEATATFTGTEPSTGSSYIIYYGGNTNPGRDEYDTTDEVVNKDYSGQTQTGNQNLSHLRFTAMLTGVNAFDHFVFSQEWATAHGGSLVINGIYKFYLQMPNEVADVTEVRLNAPSAAFYTTNAPGGRTSEIGVTLSSVNISASHILTAYAMASAQTVSMAADETYTVTVVGSDYSWVKQFTTAGAKSLGGSGTHVIQLNNDSWTKIGGKGTDAAPFLMDDPGELLLIHPLLVVNGAKRYFKLDGNVTYDSSSSTAFNTAGGLGELFNAEFDGNSGNSKTIRGLAATKPLFTNIASDASVKNLKLADDCSFAFTHPNDASFDCGAISGVLAGELNNVDVAANVSVATGAISQATALGGLVGNVNATGEINDCLYSGAIAVPSGFVATEKKIMIGGLAGQISASGGQISGSDFEGTIDNEGQMAITEETDELKNNPYLMIGGIVGFNSGEVSNCSTANHATGITVTLTDDSDHDYTGTIVTHSSVAYHWAMGGIVGRNDGTTSNCTNEAAIVNIHSAGRGTGGNNNGRYLNVGGIAGWNTAGKTVSGCTNNGGIINRANPKMHYVGGIVGHNYGSVSSCSNASTGTIGVGTSHTTPYGARQLYVGGIVGLNASDASLSNVQNAANLTVSRIETYDSIISAIGGVVGEDFNDLDGNSNAGAISNSGSISQSSGISMITGTPSDSNPYGYYLGGITGFTTSSVKNVSNTGNVSYNCTATGIGAKYVHLGGVIGKVNATSTVDVEHCTNSANVTFTATATYSANNKTRYYNNYLGGIVGYARHADIKGDSSNKNTNSGKIMGGDGSSNNNQAGVSFVVGGIVGYITGTSSIEYCDLTGSGNPYNDHWSNRLVDSYDCPTVGGIAGQIVGADGAEITVSNCAVENTASINARRGAAGGIVGLAQYAEVSDCTVPINYSTSQSGYYYGGIVGAAKNSTINSCTYSGSTIKSSQIKTGGGIVGQLDIGSTVDSCNSDATTIDKNGVAITNAGGIAGNSVAGSTIKKSHYKSTIAICGDSNYTDGGNNAADRP